MTQNDNEEQQDLTPEQAEEQAKAQAQAVFNWFQMVRQALYEQFAADGFETEGQIAQHPAFGPIFAYTLNKDGKSYSCGFFLNELVRVFQTKENPGQWVSSFFVDLIASPDSRPLPSPPQSEEETKQIFDQLIVPHCAISARAEFEDKPVYVDLDVHPEHGPVLEAGFPDFKEGNNTCAMPLHFLMTLHLLNRDPAEPLVQALYHILEQHQTA